MATPLHNNRYLSGHEIYDLVEPLLMHDFFTINLVFLIYIQE